MKILSAEEYKNKYGAQPTSRISQPEQPGYFQRLGQTYQGALSEYKEGVTRAAAQNNPLRGALRTAGTTSRVLFAPLSTALSPLLQKAVDAASDNPVVQKIANNQSVSSFLDHIDQWQQQNPDLAQDVKDIFDIATAVAGEKAAMKTGQASKTAALKTGKAAKNVKTGTGSALELAGKKIYKSADPFTPNIKEAEKIIGFRAKTTLKDRIGAELSGKKLKGAPNTIADTASKYNLMGTKSSIGVQAKKVMSTVWKKKVEPALNSIPGKISKDKVFQAIQNNIDDITDLAQREIVQHSFDKMRDTYKGVKFWSYKEAQDLKSSLASRVPETFYRGRPTGALNEVRATFAEVLRTGIRAKLPTGVKAFYDDYGNLKLIAQRGAQALTSPEKLGGSGRLLWGTIEKATTPLKTVGGKVIQNIGKALK